jgi:hypothetical protein
LILNSSTRKNSGQPYGEYYTLHFLNSQSKIFALSKINLIVYKGFYGSVHYSAADEVFYGKIEGVTDLVTFECKSVIALESAFQESVDAYVNIIQDNFSTSR